jgi:hypothetical protein
MALSPGVVPNYRIALPHYWSNLADKSPREVRALVSFGGYLKDASGANGASVKKVASAQHSTPEAARREELKLANPDLSSYMVEVLLFQEEKKKHAETERDRRGLAALLNARSEKATQGILDRASPQVACDATDGRPRTLSADTRLWMQEHKPAELAKWTGVLSSARVVERQQRMDRVVDDYDAKLTTMTKKEKAAEVTHQARAKELQSTATQMGSKREQRISKALVKANNVEAARQEKIAGNIDASAKRSDAVQAANREQTEAKVAAVHVRAQVTARRLDDMLYEEEMAAIANSRRVLQTSPRSALQSPRSGGQAHSPSSRNHEPARSPVRDHPQQHSSRGAAGGLGCSPGPTTLTRADTLTDSVLEEQLLGGGPPQSPRSAETEEQRQRAARDAIAEKLRRRAKMAAEYREEQAEQRRAIAKRNAERAAKAAASLDESYEQRSAKREELAAEVKAKVVNADLRRDDHLSTVSGAMHARTVADVGRFERHAHNVHATRDASQALLETLVREKAQRLASPPQRSPGARSPTGRGPQRGRPRRHVGQRPVRRGQFRIAGGGERLQGPRRWAHQPAHPSTAP